MSNGNIDQVKLKLQDLLIEKFGQKKGKSILKKYTDSLNQDYLLSYLNDEIILDIELIENLTFDNPYAVTINKNKDKKDNIWQIKLIKLDAPLSLSKCLPIIENFGVELLEEKPYKIKLENKDLFLSDFEVEVPTIYANKIENKSLVFHICEAIVGVLNNKVENDTLNTLVLYSDLTIIGVSVLRAIVHYLIQTALPFSKAYLAECLKLYPQIALKLYEFFNNKFNIANSDIEKANKIKLEILNDLNKVNALDHDRILKAFIAVIDAMVRTNFYQSNRSKSYISFKLESAKINFLPLPLPLFEVFVYSMNFEGIHLRGGEVARGGLRWSDRKEDYRTEIHGLMKAQMVKNVIIIPTGSKGGFVCKKLPSITDRDAYMNEVINCYKTFIAGLLDITDNLVNGKIVSPSDTIIYDEDDPYLVVAADKGTATFSDFANEMSLKYGFWLGDAFASGGTAGYDHKKIGITARGAWESVKRHFRYLGLNTQTEKFSVIGIGDMSGDVFGNGMLLSKFICLKAAFNHQDIFLDPNPDTDISFKERKRLFNLPRSSWQDYDKTKISDGGGVFSRQAKLITLSKQVREWLNITIDKLTPNELIVQILKAKADLLYNGGIGTYVKAETESNEMVKDKANDLIRINGKELNVKVVAEGGNLGFTQLGRIEYAKNGGYIYTDAIDNSAGVNCSDHEVNIKILFSDIMNRTETTVKDRNVILEKMTEEVARLVLNENYLQTDILSYSYYRSKELFNIHINFINKLEKRCILDRKVEFLPDIQEILHRQRFGIGLTMPELSVLLAYSKLVLNQDILNSDLVNDLAFKELLISYFPKYLQEHYIDNIKRHYLRKEIIANRLANLIVDFMGMTFISRFEDEFRFPTAHIIRAFWASYKLLDAENVFNQIRDLDNKIDTQLQMKMRINFKKVIERLTRWILRRIRGNHVILDLIEKYHDDIIFLKDNLNNIIKSKDYINIFQSENNYIDNGVPKQLASLISRSSYLPQLLDIVILSRFTEHSLEAVAKNYFYTGRVLKIDWLRKNIIALPENNKWQALSRSALLADVYMIYGLIIRDAIKVTDSKDNKFIQTWINKEQLIVSQINNIFNELESYKDLDLAILSAVVRELINILS